MKLELKNVKFYESMSEETNCFQADLFINGKKIAYVKNTGQGGCTDYGVHDFKLHNVLREAETYCNSLPMKRSEEFNFEYKVTLESEIDDLFEQWLKAKADKKFEKQMEKGLLYGTDKRFSYHIVSWNVPIKAMLMTDKGKEVLRKKILDIKQNGETVFNTNIPKELFN